MHARGLVAVAVAVVCSLAVVLSSGSAAGSRVRRIHRCMGIVAVPLSAPRPGPRLLFTKPPAALGSILEVLRRPRTSAAELPPGGIPRFGYSVVWFNYVHFLTRGPDQTRYYLIPGIKSMQLPASCLRSLPPSVRREYEAEARAQRAGSVTLEAFSDQAIDSEEALGTVPYTAQAIEAGDILLAIPSRTVRGPSTSMIILAGVVPDGVASVTITATNGNTETAPVTNNLFLAELPASGLQSLMIKWYAANGSLTRTIPSGQAHVVLLAGRSTESNIDISPPPAVVQSGEHQVAEFERGQLVVAQSGCLACHRIGQAGNRGPGPNLTHIGAKLSRSGIEHAIIDPTAPMPSFKHLPAAKFKAVVTFLHDLR